MSEAGLAPRAPAASRGGEVVHGCDTSTAPFPQGLSRAAVTVLIANGDQSVQSHLLLAPGAMVRSQDGASRTRAKLEPLVTSPSPSPLRHPPSPPGVLRPLGLSAISGLTKLSPCDKQVILVMRTK